MMVRFAILVGVVALLSGCEALRLASSSAKTRAWRVGSAQGCCVAGCQEFMSDKPSHARHADGGDCAAAGPGGTTEANARLAESLRSSPAAKFGAAEWLEFLRRTTKGGLRGPSFMQVGSFGPDFDLLYPIIKAADPAKTRWRGLIIEANPPNFKLLQTHYKDDIAQGRVVVRNAAVTDACEEPTVDFFAMPEKVIAEGAGWMRGIGQLAGSTAAEKAEMCRHEVRCALGSELLQQDLPKAAGWLSEDGLDFLQIDAESFEYQILLGLDLAKHRPRMIRYEATDDQFLKTGDGGRLLDHLWSAGYVTLLARDESDDRGNNDVIALRRDVAEMAAELRETKENSDEYATPPLPSRHEDVVPPAGSIKRAAPAQRAGPLSRSALSERPLCSVVEQGLNGGGEQSKQTKE